MVKPKLKDRVKLKRISKYITGFANPFMGSKYECEGEVIKFLDKGYSMDIKVLWDNKSTNNYKFNDLLVINSTTCKSIW